MPTVRIVHLIPVLGRGSVVDTGTHVAVLPFDQFVSTGLLSYGEVARGLWEGTA